ncbi:MAG: site-specific DNA-methyltransferase [Sedimentisphaerales bacterium]|nr:site-specific DNA-methyltransferase [Sedimentisphaerales bacterium]
MQRQLTLFEDDVQATPAIKVSRSGTFVDNMALPVHRWFRYSAGFAAEWVDQVLTEWGIGRQHLVLDPFVGSGTLSVVCDTRGTPSLGVEAHPLVARVCKSKLLWKTPPQRLDAFAGKILVQSGKQRSQTAGYPPLIERSYDADALTSLDAMKRAWLASQDESPASELVWLALTAILRPTSKAGTAQWQYILPNKAKKRVLAPHPAFRQQIEMMKSDLRWMQARAGRSLAEIIAGDARTLADKTPREVDAVITSPPYANNYDYADALRFEMTFWGDVNGWGDIHDAVRKYLIVSSSQHSSRERLRLADLLESDAVTPIHAELTQVVERLAEVRKDHGGKKHYHTMVAAYCRDISLVLQQLRRVCKPGSRMCWVVGDSAPYGVHCPIEKWIAELALAAGFETYRFEKLRDRNTKWKNRKHRVPLQEGLLWIQG